MIGFIVRRVLASILTLVVASFIIYVLAAYAGNPLQELESSNAINKDQLIAARIAALDLDVPPPLRWFLWISGAARCVVPFAGCDLGVNLQNIEVTTLLPGAMVSTIRLVSIATVVAIILGITIGVVSALRQYSGFDVTITFFSFFLFSLPSFLVAVLLKEFIAIGGNDFFLDPQIPIVTLIVMTVVSGFVWQAIIGGALRRRLITAAVAAVATAGLLIVMQATNFFLQPSLGPVGLLVLIAGTVAAVVALVSGFQNRRALLSAGISGALAYVSYFLVQGLFDVSTIWTIIFLGIVAVVVGVLIGAVLGGPDRGQAMLASGITAFVAGAFVVLDRVMQSWPAYLDNSRIRGRPIATVSGETAGFSGDVWATTIDATMHYTLPTIALLLISFAGYTRYARAGMLEVLNQDYVRTARAKGLPERTVVMRHAFRNMLIPLTTIVAADIGALLGGAIITETIFAIAGMGQLFNNSLRTSDLNPLMGYFVVIAIMAILFNFVADLCYAALDPRVRVK
ncbi:ABC transporter permease [Agrococcus sp. SGAir0287]|uniref:ABC transporter permease n=1 Tax=Agrococcus sp. SGAir0287 TaxID=2070347 RepID=UPI0010CD5F9C|nr:ABC transporter permease [Agrococcus sp. SGAir0287]QCR18841.1 ABC transporter permease [Agrococcus sp. SGAir0287]